MVYAVNLLLILFWSILSNITKNKRLFIVIMFIQLYLLVALRAISVGVDGGTYYNFFLETKEVSFFNFNYTRFEWGYVILNKLLIFINNKQIFLAIMAIIPLFIFLKFINEESKIPWMSIYLFITLGAYMIIFTAFRQAIAISIITISYKYLKRNNFKAFIIMVITAMLFHISALAFLPVYFVRNNKLNMKNILFYLMCGLIIFVFAEPIVTFSIHSFSAIKYELTPAGGIFLAYLFALIAIFVLALLFQKEVLRINERAIILYNILVCAIEVQILTLVHYPLSRVTTYFYLFLALLIPEVIYSIKDKKIKLICIILVIILAPIQYYLVLIRDSSGVLPYSFFFQ